MGGAAANAPGSVQGRQVRSYKYGMTLVLTVGSFIMCRFPGERPNPYSLMTLMTLSLWETSRFHFCPVLISIYRRLT